MPVVSKYAIAAAGLLVAASAAAAAGQERPAARDGWAEYLPPGPGKEMTAKACGNCHGLERIVKLRLTPEKWDSTVIDMVGRGAPLFIDEANEVIAYLGKALGPTAPPLVDVNQASKDDLAKVPGMTPEHADKLLAARKTAPLTRDQLRDVLGMDEKAFEGVRYYLFIAPAAAR